MNEWETTFETKARYLAFLYLQADPETKIVIASHSPEEAMKLLERVKEILITTANALGCEST